MDGRLHIIPLNDIRGHVSDSDLCPCLPLVWAFPGEDDRVVHMSYDGREVGEVCRKALDILGGALADHHHEWTAEERTAFEHAIHVLFMHWPPKLSEPELRRFF